MLRLLTFRSQESGIIRALGVSWVSKVGNRSRVVGFFGFVCEGGGWV